MDSDPPLQKGRRYLEAGDLVSAKEEFEKALEQDPNNAENYNSLGLVALRANRLDPEAANSFRQAIKRNPNESAYPFNLGLTFVRLNRIEEASVQFKKSLEVNPQYGPARWGLANVYFTQRRWADSKQEYLKLYASSREDPELNNQLGRIALAEGQNDIAEGYFRVAIQHAPKDSAWIYFGNLGLALKNQAKHKEAAAAFGDSLAAKPDEPYTLVNLGECFFSLGRFKEAKEKFLDALNRSPNNDQIENWLGRIGLATGNLDDAEVMFRNAAAHGPKEPAYPTNLALARMRKGLSAEAERLLKDVIGDYPDYYPAQVDLGTLYFEQNAFEKAKAEFDAVLPKARDNAAASGGILNWLGRVSLGLGRLDEAMESFLGAVAANPKEAVYQVNLAFTYTKQGKIDKAKESYRQVLALESGNALARMGLGSISFDEGDLTAAEDEFSKALPQAEGNPDLHTWLGRIELARGQRERERQSKDAFYAKAEKSYLRALELNRNSYVAQSGLGSVYFEQKEYAKARAQFALALKDNPDDPESHHWLARVAIALEDSRLAEKEFGRSIELDPKGKLPSSRLFLGSLLLRQERYKEAQERLDELVRIDPDNEDGYYELGRLYFRQKKFNEALDYQTKACGLNPGRLRGEREISLTLIELERFEDVERRLHALMARREVREGARISETVRSVNQTLANLYYRWGKAAGDTLFFDSGLEALDLARNATRADDLRGLGEIHCMRGILNCHRKQYATAQGDFERSIKYFLLESTRPGGGGPDPTYYVAVRNLDRLHESFALVGGIDPIWLKRLSISLAILSAAQLVLLWCLFLAHWSGISPKMFATLNPVFFGMILLSLLLPQLSKFKLGGITAEVAKPEQIQGFKTDWELPRPEGFGHDAPAARSGALPEAERVHPQGFEIAEKAHRAPDGKIGGASQSGAKS
jgi:tetratricopeptide (TPR) repeat protein